MKILLHTCCAPCLIHPHRVLTESGYEVTSFFYNPNIHPFREYRERYLALAGYCDSVSVPLSVGPYEMERFLAEVSTSAARPGTVPPESAGAPSPVPSLVPGSRKAPGRPARCETCYRIRLERTAAEARALGIGEFTTTLLVSPYQDHALIKRAGDAAAMAHGVLFVAEDMTGGFRDGERAARDLGIYRQSYCGCVYSEKERYQKSDPPGR